MVGVWINTRTGVYEQHSLMFVCPTVERAKQIMNDNGHVKGDWRHYVDCNEHVANVANDPFARYMISPVEYQE